MSTWPARCFLGLAGMSSAVTEPLEVSDGVAGTPGQDLSVFEMEMLSVFLPVTGLACPLCGLSYGRILKPRLGLQATETRQLAGGSF